jgi:hypothetical protein
MTYKKIPNSWSSTTDSWDEQWNLDRTKKLEVEQLSKNKKFLIRVMPNYAPDKLSYDGFLIFVYDIHNKNTFVEKIYKNTYEEALITGKKIASNN